MSRARTTRAYFELSLMAILVKGALTEQLEKAGVYGEEGRRL